MPQVCVVTTGAGRHFCDLSASYDVSAFAEFEALGVSVYTDKDEWEGYRVIKSDPVLHVEVRRPAPTSGAATLGSRLTVACLYGAFQLHKWADIVIVAPCSANTLGKLANGLADNLLVSQVSRRVRWLTAQHSLCPPLLLLWLRRRVCAVCGTPIHPSSWHQP